jgi:hypothetical protein
VMTRAPRVDGGGPGSVRSRPLMWHGVTCGTECACRADGEQAWRRRALVQPRMPGASDE